ncbi:amidohydrolase family protein [Microbacterium rhizosphaerae]
MTLMLRNGRSREGAMVDIAISAGRIDSITPAAGCLGDGDEDLGGRAVLPLLVNGHAHLDKTFLGGPWQPHAAGSTVRERIEVEKRQRRLLDETALERAMLLAQRMVEFGTGTLRAHVDVDAEIGLSGVERMLAVQEAFRGLLDVQIVAFPQSGIRGQAGVADLLEEALRLGVTGVGGLDPISLDGDLDGHLDIVFDVARRYGADVDIHLHGVGAAAEAEYRAVAHRAGRLAGRVTMSHAFGLGTLSDDVRRAILDLLAENQVAVMTNGPAGPMPPVRELVDHGVPVFVGTDNIRDAWWPFGTGDVLETARNVAFQSSFYRDEDLRLALELVTDRAASALGLTRYGLAPGAPADLLVVNAANAAEAVAAPPVARDVMRGGTWVARTRVQVESSVTASATGATPAVPSASLSEPLSPVH